MRPTTMLWEVFVTRFREAFEQYESLLLRYMRPEMAQAV
jgi:hypothetical protein